MEIIAYPQAREILLVRTEQILPPGGLYVPDLFAAIALRYEFQTAPQGNTSIDQLLDGAKFVTGKLELADRDEAPFEVPIQELTVYNNGLVAIAHKSEDAQAFLNDLFSWGELMFGLRPPIPSESWKNRLCASQIVVQFEQSVDDLLSKFQSITKLIEAQMRLLYPTIGSPLYLKNLTIDYDKATVPSNLDTLVGFFIERRVGVPFADNVIFSQAPLPTDQHSEYLTDLEILLRRP